MRVKKITIAGLICLFLGVATLFTGFVLSGFDIAKTLPEAQYQTKSFTSNEPVQEIIVDEKNLAVQIRQSGDDNVHISYHEYDHYYYEINLSDDGILRIIKKDTSKWYDYIFNFNFMTNNLTIAVPSDFSGPLSVENSNGSIDIKEVNAKNIILRTSNGKITAEDVMTSEKFEASTSNASINLIKLKSAGDIICHTSSGKVTFEEVEANNIDVKTSNASVDINEVLSENDIIVETSNAQIRFDNIDFGRKLECHSSNASIKGEVKGELTDYSIRSKTSNGANNLPDNASGGAKTIDIETSNSSIEVNFTDE